MISVIIAGFCLFAISCSAQAMVEGQGSVLVRPVATHEDLEAFRQVTAAYLGEDLLVLLYYLFILTA
jgi:hypothetical protein